MDLDTQQPEALEQVAPEAPQTVDTPVPEAGEGAPVDENQTAAPEEKPAKAEVPHGLQKRMDYYVWKAHEAERQLESERLERLRSEAQAAAIQKVQAIDAKEPQPDQFETTTDYLSAHSRWASARALEIFDARQSIQQSETMLTQMAEGRKQQEAAARMQDTAHTLETKLAEGPKKYKDFVEVLTNPALPSAIGTPLFDAVMATDHAVDISYTLGKNPAEYERLLRLSYQNPVLAFKEVLSLDAKFAGASKTTSAPPPPTEIKGSPSVQKDPNKMSYDEYVAWRRKTIKARNSR